MANSVNTNFGAAIALQSLNRTNKQLDVVQKRVSTGFKVADAKDDGAAFAVAQGLRGTVKANEAVGERLSVAKGLLSVTQEGLKGISDTVGEMRKVMVKLADANLSDDERDKYSADYGALRGDVERYMEQSNFGGVNLLLTATNDINVIADAKGDTITLTAHDVQAALGTLQGYTAGTPITQALAADALDASEAASIDAFEGVINTALATVGANSRTIENQDSFIKVVSDSIEDGIGAIVDADLAKESARLQALQIRQQLGTQALSIANQAPSILLSLFR